MEDPKLFVVMDFDSSESVLESCCDFRALRASNFFGVKINLDLLLKKQIGFLNHEFMIKPIIADLKMFNGIRTMISAIKHLAGFVDYVTIHAQIGISALKQLVFLQESTNGIKVIANTILTHYSSSECLAIYSKPIDILVRKFTLMAYEAGCYGVTVPGTMLECIADIDIKKFVPGIRYGVVAEDVLGSPQVHVVFPKQAFEGGATSVICGRPIFKAKDKNEAIIKILNFMK